MKKFSEWHDERISRKDEGFGRNLAMGAALAGGMMGFGKQSAAAASQPADGTDMLAPSDKSWNSELGDFRSIKLKDGTIIYRTAKGDFKQVNAPLSATGFKFVKVN